MSMREEPMRAPSVASGRASALRSPAGGSNIKGKLASLERTLSVHDEMLEAQQRRITAVEVDKVRAAPRDRAPRPQPPLTRPRTALRRTACKRTRTRSSRRWRRR